MVTTGPTSGVPGLPARSTPAAPPQWRTGQLLQATVTERSIGKVLLSIGNRQVSAETSLPLEKGQQLTLQVRSLGIQPELKIISALKESPLAGMVRLLLPRQAPLTPLLASMKQVARLPNPPRPALLNEQIRATLRQMPDIPTVSTPQGLKKAIADSGVFLEQRLLQGSANRADAPPVQGDFKASLLRLVQLVRNWAATGTRTTAGTPTPAAATPAAAAQPAGTGLNAPPPATAAPPATDARAPAQQPAATSQDAVRTAQPAAPDQLRRAARAGLPGAVASAARPAATTSPSVTGAPPAGGSSAGAAPPAMLPGGELPAPLRGAVPVPQSALQASLDLINRLGNFRADLLQQAESALARIQLHQLAAVPREGERGLLEWLFELPIRRADDIDLWSMRLLRDDSGQQREAQPASPHWTVQLAFDLPGLGAVQAQVQLRNEQVSAHFWAEQTDTLPLFREHLHELHAALCAAGLEVADLDCRHGSRPAAKTGGDPPLIREKV
ncbi:MAG: flagellar hook-length control protein FliK [Thiogranum sp.]